MATKRYIDNRDMRDLYYQGPLVLESDEPWATNKKEAEEKMYRIMQNDLINLQQRLEREEELEACPQELVFTLEHTVDFRGRIRELYDQGSTFEHPYRSEPISRSEFERTFMQHREQDLVTYHNFYIKRNSTYVFIEHFFAANQKKHGWKRRPPQIHPIYRTKEQLQQAIQKLKNKVLKLKEKAIQLAYLRVKDFIEKDGWTDIKLVFEDDTITLEEFLTTDDKEETEFVARENAKSILSKFPELKVTRQEGYKNYAITEFKLVGWNTN